MKQAKFIIIGIMCVSLIMIIIIIGKIQRLENQMSSISNYQNDIMWSVDSQAYNVQSTLEDFRREQSWISTIEMSVEGENFEDNKAFLSFRWQVKELFKDSEVKFHYRIADNEFTTLPATEIADGVFGVSITTDVSLQPEWYHSISSYPHDSARWNHVETIEEEFYRDGYYSNELSYYVTVKSDDVVRSSEIAYENINFIGTNVYGFLETHVSISEKGYSVTVSAHPYYHNQAVHIDEAHLITYRNDQLVSQVKMEQEKTEFPEMQGDLHYFYRHNDEVEKYTSLVVKVVYSNGQEFVKEIY